MKKLLAILLVLAMAFALVACTSTPVAEEPVADVTAEPEAQTEAETETTEETADVPETTEEVTEDTTAADVTYVPLTLSFKNKTGVTITGLYLYPTGAEDKGNSICEAEWIDQDNDPEEVHYEIFVYIVRAEAATYDLYVTFADGTDATWEGLTIANYDKLSLKNGVDPAGWEQEPLDDAEDIAKADAAKAAGKTADNYYPGYEILGLEIKNKTGKNIVEFYLYETGSEEHYGNMVPMLVDAEGNAITAWESGKGGLYVFDFFIRPYAETYEVYVVYEDGTDMTITEIDLFTPNGDGFRSNEISMKDAVDPDLTEVSYDDGDPEPLQDIIDAIAEGIPADGWYPVY